MTHKGFELWLTTDTGARLDILDEAESFEWSRVINGIGRCRVTLTGDFDLSLLSPDNRIEIWREPSSGAKLRLEDIYFIRRIVPTTNQDGLQRITVRAMSPTELLLRRIIAFAAGSSQSAKTDNVDDMMKEIVRENLGASAGNDGFGASRSFDATFFSVQADATLGPSITKNFSWRNVLIVLQDLSDVAREAGTELYFAVVPTSTTTFEFEYGKKTGSAAGSVDIMIPARPVTVMLLDRLSETAMLAVYAVLMPNALSRTVFFLIR